MKVDSDRGPACLKIDGKPLGVVTSTLSFTEQRLLPTSPSTSTEKILDRRGRRQTAEAIKL